MYGEWSCASVGPQGEEDCASVLNKFPESVGKEVAISVVHHLASTLGLTQPPEPSKLSTQKEVAWSMEVISYGMSLPLSEHDTIRDCVNVYCEWLSALLPIPKICVPKPICDDPNVHARKMISHFYNLFVPRKGEAADTINRQAVLCHRVLRTLQNAAQCSNIMDGETWEALLLFLLSINDTLLAPPTVKDGVGDQLCERVLSVLFELWLLACARSFPTAPVWSSLYHMCTNWRHRPALVDQWNRVNLALTARLLPSTFGPSFPQLKIVEEDWQLVPSSISQDGVAQAWYRFLYCLGNPVDLCRPALISQTHKFLQFSLMSETVGDPCQHPCLAQLPIAFLRAMQGVSTLVDAFLGIVHLHPLFSEETEKKEPSPSQTPSPPRRMAKSFSVAPSAVTKGIPRAALIGLTGRVSLCQAASTPNSGPPSTSSVGSSSASSIFAAEPKCNLSPLRPKCNSILHLFGEWLFEAAHIGCEVANPTQMRSDNSSSTLSVPTTTTSSSNLVSGVAPNGQPLLKRPGSLLVDGKKGGSMGVQASALMDSVEVPPWLAIAKYEAGRAQAVGALCRIFCSKRTGEEILPSYLARFYLAIHYGLKPSQPRVCSDLAASILLNSADLLRLDLDGVHVLVPSVIQALEVVLPDRDVQIMSNNVSKVELRRASIHLLLSMLALPLHFQNLPIKDVLLRGSEKTSHLTFAQLKPALVNLLINTLQIETDSQNTHMLLGGLQMCVLDSASFEDVDQVTQVDSQDTSSNLLCSDTFSSHSLSECTNFSEEGSDQSSIGDTISDTAHALFVRATYLVCHRLISSWKTDLNVSLAALELLGGLAKAHIQEQDSLECKRAVKWLCDYIMYQCSRPPPAHSKDLHSSIVAAFQCAASWLVAHPYLLGDKDTLVTLLEVMELGISGTKSQGKPGERLQKKHEKDLKPVSMRVRDAAEALLTVALEQVGHYPKSNGVWQVAEHSLLSHWHTGLRDEPGSSVSHFHYFALENSTILALLEEPLGNDQDPQPTITSLIRGPFGCHGWAMQLRHLPRHKAGSKFCVSNPGRPVPMCDGSKTSLGHLQPRYFPESVDLIPMCKADKCVPALESPASQLLKQLVEQQETSELERIGDSQSSLSLNLEGECNPPQLSNEFQTARLFLSHFGFLSPEALQETLCSPIPSLVSLDSLKNGFYLELEALDCIGTRTCDTVHLFYVRSGQTTGREILSNVTSKETVHSHFLEFIHSLGWPVDVHSHQHWTGHVSTSWKVSNITPAGLHKAKNSSHGGSLYNGDMQVIYWTDVTSEVAFVVPTPRTSTNIQSICKEKMHTLSLDLDHQKTKNTAAVCDAKVLVFWLESFEDRLTLPLGDLLQETSTGTGDLLSLWESNCFVVCIQSLQSGLFRIHMQGPTARVSLASPLVDGMVVGRRVLGPLVRHTTLNMCKRRRLESENYQPPHVRRKLKIQEIVQKYREHVAEPDFYTRLFQGKYI